MVNEGVEYIGGIMRISKNKQIRPPYDRTIPDLYYEDEDDDVRVAVYVDGLSKGIHGNDKQKRIDNMIRNQLEDMDIDVISIAASDLNNPMALNKRLRKIGRKDLQRKYKQIRINFHNLYQLNLLVNYGIIFKCYM